MWTITNSGKLFQKWELQTTLPISRETCMQDKKQQLEPDMEKWTGSKLRSTSRLYIVTLQNAGWTTHKLELRLLREISATSDTQMIPL